MDQAAMTQVIAEAAVEAAKAIVQSMAAATGEDSPDITSEPTSTRHKIGGVTLKQYMFGLNEQVNGTQKLQFRSK